MLYIFLFFLSIACLLFDMCGHTYMFSLFSLSLVADTYSISFFSSLIIISCSVIIWSYHYMDNEKNYLRFLYLLSFFLMSMIALIFSSNLFVSFVGWDLLGISSFFLVVFYKNRKSLGSGMMTSLTNRLGDCLFFGLLSYHSCAALFLLIIMSMTKSAQIPFSSWLPAAMAAPTPVSALVHSSTLVTAGIYMLIRYCYINISFLVLLGGLTMTLAGFCACMESDIKKVIALSTLSQLGVMFMSLGANEKSFCFFHLLSHAFFKALLFMCVGNYIHSMYGSQDYRSHNSYHSYLFLVSSLSLMGFTFTSGFFSKESIYELLSAGELQTFNVIIFLLGICLTAAYTIKMLSSTSLLGKMAGSSNMKLTSHSRTLPLNILGTFSIVFGTQVDSLCGLKLSMSDPMPMLMMLIGTTLGCLYLCNPFLSSMGYMTNITQLLSTLALKNLQKIDKGTLEALTPNINLMLYTPSICIGLSVFFLLLLYV